MLLFKSKCWFLCLYKTYLAKMRSLSFTYNNKYGGFVFLPLDNRMTRRSARAFCFFRRVLALETLTHKFVLLTNSKLSWQCCPLRELRQPAKPKWRKLLLAVSHLPMLYIWSASSKVATTNTNHCIASRSLHHQASRSTCSILGNPIFKQEQQY